MDSRADNIRFSNPPLNEVVLDVSFSDSKWGVEHFGLYFEEHVPKFVGTKIQHPLPPAGLQPTGLALVTEAELPRVWYEFEEKPFLVQIQKDRFILNWRKVTNLNNVYPLFKEFYGRFETEWNNFSSFCSAQDVGNPKVNRIELTYINHLVKGQHWNTLAELSQHFRSLAFVKDYSELSAFSFSAKYLSSGIPILQSYKPAKTATGEDLYIVELKTMPQVSAPGEMQAAMKKSNAILVEEFVRITSELAHKNWGLSGV